jgi:hypothetical protein
VEDVKKVEDEKDEDDWELNVGKRPNDGGGALGVEKSSMEDSEKYDPTRALERVVGQEAAKAKIQNLVNALQVNRRRVAAGGRAEPAPHVVLAGAPGVGKSMLARMVAHIVSECDVSRHGPLVRPSRQDLVALGRAPGRTAELVAQQCEKAEGGVLLIDDFHRMLPDARGDAAGARDAPGYEAMEALASEVERRARKAGKGIVLILAGEAEGVAAARRACPPLDALLPEPLALPDFSPREVAILVDAMASERGFALAPGLRDDARLEAHVAEAARCADPARRNAHLARSLLERAIDAQTERVFSLGTVGKDTLTGVDGGGFHRSYRWRFRRERWRCLLNESSGRDGEGSFRARKSGGFRWRERFRAVPARAASRGEGARVVGFALRRRRRAAHGFRGKPGHGQDHGCEDHR